MGTNTRAADIAKMFARMQADADTKAEALIRPPFTVARIASDDAKKPPVPPVHGRSAAKRDRSQTRP